MKKWNAAEIVELNIHETAMEKGGVHHDGGTFGDGHLGILETCDDPNCLGCKIYNAVTGGNSGDNNGGNDNETEFTS